MYVNLMNHVTMRVLDLADLPFSDSETPTLTMAAEKGVCRGIGTYLVDLPTS